MKIKMLKSSICDGKRVSVDQVVDASDKAARFLLLTGKAVVSKSAPVVEEDQPAEDAPQKRGRKRAPVNRMVEEDEIENRAPGE